MVREDDKMGTISDYETRKYNSSKTSYASKYYNPQKAHEYYLQNRQLKGYGNTGANDGAKANQSYGKKNISYESGSNHGLVMNEHQQKAQYYSTMMAERKKKLSSEISKVLKSASSDAERLRLATAMKHKLEQVRMQISGNIEKAKSNVSDKHDSRTETLISKLQLEKQHQAKHNKG